MECGVVVTGLYFCIRIDIVCVTSLALKGKELILSVFTDLNEENSTRQVYRSSLAV